MHPVEALTRLGGVADHASLLEVTSRRKLRTSLARDEVRRVGRNRYALPTADEGRLAAARLSGAASHLSAAMAHRWEIATQPREPMVAVPRNRKVGPQRRKGVDLRWRHVSREELQQHLTEPYRTVLHCARDLPFSEALTVADSALRHGDVDKDRLVAMVLELPSRGRERMLRVATNASAKAANPFESVLRAISLDVPGLHLEPQVVIADRGFRGRPDLVDVQRKIVVEADSYRFHAGRRAFSRDCERYNALVIRGWTVLRFTWEQVMFEADRVRDALRVLVRPHERALLTSSLLWAG